MAWNDASGTITAAHTPQKIYTGGTATGVIRFLNVSQSVIWVNTGAVAGPGSGSYRRRPDQGADETWLPVDADIYAWGEQGAEFTLKHD